MITTETLETMLRDLRFEYNHLPRLNKSVMGTIYDAEFQILEKLIEISKEAEK